MSLFLEGFLIGLGAMTAVLSVNCAVYCLTCCPTQRYKS
jgi:hypothetical protein